MSVLWNISERSVRDYCNKGRVPGAFLDGKTWNIPETATKPKRQVRHTNIHNRLLLEVLKDERSARINGGIYHKLQVEMTYNSNHIEGSKLTHDGTRFIYETKTIGKMDEIASIDDIVETVNHFRCIDIAIDMANYKLSESLIKQFHYVLKTGTSDANDTWFKVGDYKLLENEVSGLDTVKPEDVKVKMQELLKEYNAKKDIELEDIVDFHYKFEIIHPFQDGNGRVGRLIMFKECLKHNIVPIIINDDIKAYYYRGLKEYKYEKGYLLDTCRYGQDIVKEYLKYFKIPYED